MTVTIIGDSLTAGNLGIPYMRYLNPPEGTAIINRGRDGDTVRGVRERLEESLRADRPDVLVVEIGANDILLPEMAARGGNWTPFVERMLTQGSIPTPDPDDFIAMYADLLHIAGSWGTEHIICLSIPPVGENLGSERNRRREVLNRRIRELTVDEGLLLLDIAAAFENELKSISLTSDYFFDDPGEFVIDARLIRRKQEAAILSEERGLFFTMDGAHLNEKGAALMARVISESLAGL